MKNKNLVLKAVSAVAGVLGVIFGFLVNFDFKVYGMSEEPAFLNELTTDSETWKLFSKPQEEITESYSLLTGNDYKSVFKIIGAVAFIICIVAILVLIASLVVDLLNKKCEVLDKVANIAKYVLAGAVVVFVAGIVLYMVTNIGSGNFIESEIDVKLAVVNLVMFILSAVMLAGSAVCAFFANRKAK